MAWFGFHLVTIYSQDRYHTVGNAIALLLDSSFSMLQATGNSDTLLCAIG